MTSDARSIACSAANECIHNDREQCRVWKERRPDDMVGTGTRLDVEG